MQGAMSSRTYARGLGEARRRRAESSTRLTPGAIRVGEAYVPSITEAQYPHDDESYHSFSSLSNSGGEE
jgi:hypothetical protein